MAEAEKYAILQSGFLAYSNLELNPASVIPDSDIVQSLKLGKPVKERNNPYFYSKIVNDLFTEYEQDNAKLKDFDFREHILQAAKFVFDGRTIADWVKFQCLSEYYTVKHSNFLADTLRYLKSGKREMSIDTWLHLVNASLPGSKKQGKCLYAEFAQYKMRTYVHFLNTDVESINTNLVHWVSHEGGFRDLLIFMKIVFGKPEER